MEEKRNNKGAIAIVISILAVLLSVVLALLILLFCKGEQGDVGPKGDTGSQGEKGDPGSNGSDGANGSDGQDGSDGLTAYSNTILASNGGTITVDKGSAVVGESITFYFTPDTNYTLYSFTLNSVEHLAADATLTDSTYEYSTTMVENGFVVSATFYANVTTNASDAVSGNVLDATVADKTNKEVVVDKDLTVQKISSSMTDGTLVFGGGVDATTGEPTNTITIGETNTATNALYLNGTSEEYGFVFDLEATSAKRSISFKNVNIKLDRDGLTSLFMIANDGRSEDRTELVFDNVNIILTSELTSSTRVLQAQWIRNVSFNGVKIYSATGVSSYFYNPIELIGSNLEKLTIKDCSFSGSYAKLVFVERTSKDGVIDVSNSTFTNNASAYNGAFTFGNAGYDTTTYDNPMVLNIKNTNLNMNMYGGMYILGQINAWSDSSNPYVRINFDDSTINGSSINPADDIYVAIYTDNRSEGNTYSFPGFYVDGTKATVEY